jgi:hypothetical protein
MAHKISIQKVTNHQILQRTQSSLRCALRVLLLAQLALRFRQEAFHLVQSDLFGMQGLLANHTCKCRQPLKLKNCFAELHLSRARSISFQSAAA